MTGQCALEERAFRDKLENALVQVRLILEVNRQPTLAENVHHSYEDKYLLTERMVQTMLASQGNCLELLGLQAESFKAIRKWSEESSAVSLHFRAEERCSFLREEKHEVEHKTKSVVEGSFLERAFSCTSKTVQTVVDYYWRHDVTYRLEVVRGVGATEADTILLLEEQDHEELKTSAKMSPRPEASIPACDVKINIGWMVQQLKEGVPKFTINRERKSCRTPRRNPEVEAALQHLSDFSDWASEVVSYSQGVYALRFPDRGTGALLPVFPLLEESSTRDRQVSLEVPADMQCHIESGSEGANLQLADIDWNRFLAEEVQSLRSGLQDAYKQTQVAGTTMVFTDTDGDVVEMRLEFGSINQYVNGQIAVRNLTKFHVDMANRTYQDDGGHGAFRPEEDLDDIIRRRDRTFLAAASQGAAAEPTWANPATAARLCYVLGHCEDVCDQTQKALDYVEAMLWKQLAAAIGKEVGPSDFTEYMIFHMRRLFKTAYSPTAFSLPVRRSSNHTPEGTVSVEQTMVGPTSSKMMQPIFTLDACSTAPHPMRFSLSASSSVTFHGERHLHAYLRNEFSNEAGASLTLMARARQFSSMIVLLGRVVSAQVFDPKAAIIVQNKDEISIPLQLTTIPTAKEFKDAIGSLSPEQQEFAKAYRGMQLEGTLFALLVIPIKPQLEVVLNMAPDSLTKEIKLTQDLMQLFIKYQIPSDLLSYNPQSLSTGTDAATAAVMAVQEHVACMMQMLDEAKREELRQREEEVRLNRLQEEERRRQEELQERLAWTEQCEAEERRESMLFLSCKAESLQSASTSFSKVKSMRRSIAALSGSAPMAERRCSLVSAENKEEQGRKSDKQQAKKPAGENESGQSMKAPDPPIEQGSPCDQPAGGEATSQGMEAAPDNPRRDAQVHSACGAASTPSPVIRDYTLVPVELDSRCESFDSEGALRPTTINLGETWHRRSQKALLAKTSEETLNAPEQKQEKDAAFDLLDALTKSGSLAIRCATLHIVVAATHCFDKSVMESVVQDSVNPIEKVERSALIMASTVYQNSVASLVHEAERERLSASMQLLLEDSP